MQPFNSGYDGDPELYDQLRTCWLNEHREQFLSSRIEACRLPADAVILEIGSGTGWLLNRLAARFPHLSFAGVEPIGAYVEYARRQAPSNVRYVESTLEGAARLAQAPCVLLSNDVLHHVPSYVGALQSAGRLAGPECLWLAIEPNFKNPYTFVRQATGYGEQNFWPRRFRRMAAIEGWEFRAKGHLFLVPPGIKHAPRWMTAIESRFERVPFLAGGVYLEFAKR